MDRTERFYKIELLLRSRGCVSFAALRAELEVSPATLKRDLQYLRDRLSAPIVYDALENGYRFSGAAAAGSGGSTPRQELPGLWFSESEVHALLTMHQLLAGLEARARQVRTEWLLSQATSRRSAGHQDAFCGSRDIAREIPARRATESRAESRGRG